MCDLLLICSLNVTVLQIRAKAFSDRGLAALLFHHATIPRRFKQQHIHSNLKSQVRVLLEYVGYLKQCFSGLWLITVI